MIREDPYWWPLCELVGRHRCWVRLGFKEGTTTFEGWWSQLLTIPVPGYLESAGGPTPMADVQWVEIALARIRGGVAGRPRTTVDASSEIIAALSETPLIWELRTTTWSVAGLFEEEPVRVARVIAKPVPRAPG